MAYLESASHTAGRTPALSLRWGLALVVAAVVVALAARIAVPVPGTPVPMALSPLAVLVVGGILGARGGAGALAGYVGAGAIGLPVFAAGGGAAYLLGPTGGYVLAFPIAAAIVGALAAPGRLGRSTLAAAAGMAAIHLGGIAQLTILGGDVAQAWRWGSLPFLLGDVLKIAIAGVLIARVTPSVRSYLAAR
ncbi:MAG: biotin transporter BioY [Gemmatimonadales bacterium]|jgi:biotin transport system substrate-specific component|nr:MAG: biotin transporter BioY [Gemmatimonadales bacterium]